MNMDINNNNVTEVTPKTAVVLGGSVAGLLSAVALASSFDKVIVVERDDAPNDDASAPLVGRKGTPQDQHAHGILTGGCEAIENLLPGFIQRMVQNGALFADRARDLAWFHDGHRLAPYDNGGVVLLLTRPVVDRTIRQMAQEKFPGKITMEWNTTFSRLVVNHKNTVTGAMVCPRGYEAERSAERILHAHIVVDATGRASNIEKQVIKMGFPPVQTLDMTINMGYSTMVFEMDDDDECIKATKGIMVLPSGTNPRGGAATTIVNHANKNNNKTYVLATVYGFHDERPLSCSSLAQWMAFARSLPTPALADWLETAKPLCAIPKPYTSPKQFFRRYDLVRNEEWPAGLICVGDSVCALNPCWGQGITIASLQAVELRAQVASRLCCTASAQRAIAQKAWLPFMMNCIEDHRYTKTTGWAPPLLGVAQLVTSLCFRAATKSPVVWDALLKVANLQASPLSLVSPGVLLRVLWGWLVER